MPRITAPTVVEHRERQLRALLDSARVILGETGAAPTLAATAERAGLARSSIYRYFASAEDLLTAVVADLLPSWARQVHERVEGAETAGEKVWAYVCANVDLFASPEQDIAHALREAADPRMLQKPMEAFHADLQRPLVAALADHGEPDPQKMAETIEAALIKACQGLRESEAAEVKETALGLLRRLLGGYLGLP